MEPQIDDTAFARAYNDGFLIGKFEQEVADYMMESMKTDTNYLFGFKAGLEHGDAERLEQTRLEELETSRDQSSEQDQEQHPEQGLDL